MKEFAANCGGGTISSTSCIANFPMANNLVLADPKPPLVKASGNAALLNKADRGDSGIPITDQANKVKSGEHYRVLKGRVIEEQLLDTTAAKTTGEEATALDVEAGRDALKDSFTSAVLYRFETTLQECTAEGFQPIVVANAGVAPANPLTPLALTKNVGAGYGPAVGVVGSGGGGIAILLGAVGLVDVAVAVDHGSPTLKSIPIITDGRVVP